MKSSEVGGTQYDSPSEHSEGVVGVNYDAVDVPDWFIEPGEEHGYRPWQHTPLRPYDASMSPHQQALYAAFERLATAPIPPDMSPAVAHLIHLDFLTGSARRQTECQSNFEAWRTHHPDEYAAITQDEGLRWLLGEALTGHANPASLLRLLEHAPSLPSLDLQVLTTPFGYRRHNIPAMRAELAETVHSIGGELFESPVATHEPMIAVHRLDQHGSDQDELGVIVTQKQLVGAYTYGPNKENDIFIMERQAYVMLTDSKSGFSEDIAKLLRTVSGKDPRFKKIKDYVSDRITKREGLIPTSTMVYAYREVKKQESQPGVYSAEIQEARREAAMAQIALSNE
jgi:hypothetical protein